MTYLRAYAAPMTWTATIDHRRRRHTIRLAAGGSLVVGALLTSACGGSDEGATQSTLSLSSGSTAFVVRMAETTTPSADTTVPTDGISPGAQDYTIQGGDYPLGVASQFGVSLDDLVAFNEWGSAAEFPHPGTVIKIPPGATVASATTTIPSGTPSSTSPGATIPDAGDNCGEGEHIVEEGDIPIDIAEQYDVTLEALNAANADNPAYSQFIPGQTIIIPSKSDC